MRAIFHPEADDDFTRGLRHYAALPQPELGQRFYHHVNELVAEIEDDPTLFRAHLSFLHKSRPTAPTGRDLIARGSAPGKRV